MQSLESVNNIVIVVVNYYSRLRHCRWAVDWVGVLMTGTRSGGSGCSIAAPETAKTQLCMACLKTLLPRASARRLMLVDGALLGVRRKTSLSAHNAHARGRVVVFFEVAALLWRVLNLLFLRIRRYQTPLLVIDKVAWITNETLQLSLCGAGCCWRAWESGLGARCSCCAISSR